jgi:hypothetical protein
MTPEDIEEQESTMIINCQYDLTPAILGTKENKFSTVANSNNQGSQ